ncbi:hypothetical protein [Pantoea agglomerans]|uniref:hypothetical protein n=2 Tax=Enterobacter agglomerans TaxID=549 RepID=UPI003C7BE01C
MIDFQMTEYEKLASEHAWKYFEIHAQQRITVFNFYIAITGLLAAGIGFSLQNGGSYFYLSALIGIFMAFMSFIFWKLDSRVSILIKNAEESLKNIELKFSDENYKIFNKDFNDDKLNNGINNTWSYGKCFRISFFVVGNAGLVLTIASITMGLIS